MRRDNSTIVSNSEVKDIGLCDDNDKLIKSHFAITCELHHRRISVKSKSIAYHKLKNINVDQFKRDICESAILKDVIGSVGELLNTYTMGLTTLLDIHAPLITVS